MDRQRDAPDTHAHSFHIPNSFSRSGAGQGAQYQALAREELREDDVTAIMSVAAAEEEEGEEDNDDDNLSGPADASSMGDVESMASWSKLSNAQRLLVRIMFGVLGASVLVPFNAVISPSEFYRTLLRGTPYEVTCMSWIVVVYNICSVILGAHATVTLHGASITQRILASSTVIIVVLLLTVALTSIAAAKSFAPSGYNLILILILSTTMSSATAYLQLSVVTLCNAYGPGYLGAMLAGQGFSGVVVSLVQLSAAYANANTVSNQRASNAEAKAALSFYAVNTAFMAAALAAYWRMTRTELYGRVKARMDRANLTDATDAEAANRAVTSESASGTVRGVRRYMTPSIEGLYDRIAIVQRKTLLSSLSTAYVFIVTLAVYPALTSRVRPMGANSGSNPDGAGVTLLFVAWHFLAFNTGDLLGRSLPAVAPSVFCTAKLRLLAMLCLLRTALVPLLAACNVSTALTVAATPFSSPTFFLLTITLGISNGILATSLFIAGPRHPSLSSAAERNLAAGLLSWWLCVGLAIGSFLSFFVGSA